MSVLSLIRLASYYILNLNIAHVNWLLFYTSLLNFHLYFLNMIVSITCPCASVKRGMLISVLLEAHMIPSARFLGNTDTLYVSCLI